MEEKSKAQEPKRWSYHNFYLLFLIFAICGILYYMGEIADFFNWEALRLGFFYSVHDIHRLLFLAPIIFAAYHFGMRATVIMIILTICMFLPRALFISPYPDPLLRTGLFTLVAAAVGVLYARERDRCRYLERLVKKD